MKILTKVTGITFAIKENPNLASARPEGEVLLILEDNEHAQDGKALSVWSSDTKIGKLGYITEKPEMYQESTKSVVMKSKEDGKNPRARIEKCWYKKEGGWNNEEGELCSVQLCIEDDDGNIDETKRVYKKEGKKYQSITAFLGRITSDFDGLLYWAMKKFRTFKEYKEYLTQKANEGTQMHEKMETIIIEKAELEGEFNILSQEETVYDETLHLAGRYDCMIKKDGKRIMIDWKSSKSVQDKHKKQIAFYAKNTDCEEAWIVYFGKEKPFKEILTKSQIDYHYNKLFHLKEYLS